MSDHSPLHKAFTRIFLGGVLVCMIIALVLTGNSDTVRNNIGGRNVAQIGDKSISAQEFEMIYARRIAQSGMNDTMARKMGVPSMVLQSEIERQTLLQAAKKLGIRINDPYVAKELIKQLEQVQLSGTPKEKLNIILSQQQLTEEDLVNMMRNDATIKLLASTVTTGDIDVPAPLLLSAYQAEKQKRSIEIIPITLENLKNKKALAQKDIEAFYNEHKEAYRIPEARDISALVLPQKLFVKEATLGENEAKAYFDAHSDQFIGPERVQLEQSIFTTEAAAKKAIAEKPAALEALKDAQYLKNDWYSKTTLPKEFVTALYPAKPKGFVGPVKTTLGWHVLNVATYEEGKPVSFADIRSKIERQLKDEKIDQQMTDATNELDNMIAEDASLAAIAKKYNLHTVSFDNLQANNAVEKLKEGDLSEAAQKRIQEAAFTLQDGEISPLMDTANGDYVLVQLNKINASSIPELKSIQKIVAADAEKTNENRTLLSKAEDLIGSFDPKDTTKFDKAVKDAGLTVQSLPAETKEALASSYDKQLAELAYTLGPDNRLSYVQGPGKVTLVRLRNIIQNNDVPDDKAKETITETVKNDVVQELQQQFLAAWQKELNIRVNNELLQSLFAPQAKDAAQ